MKAAITVQDGLGMSEVDEGALAAGEVRIKVAYCGICGSDVNHYSALPPGTVMGHELTGRIIEMGDGVSGWSIGDRVNPFPFQSCNACPQCEAGRQHLCRNPSYMLGVNHPGGFAERVVVLDTMLVRIPDSLDDRTAALVEPLSVGLHAITMSGVEASVPALVLGAGPIGFLAVLALRARGFKRLVVVEPRMDRRKNLEQIGVACLETADSESIRELLGEEPGVIFECAGFRDALSVAISLIAPRGTIVATSVPTEPVPLPQWNLIEKEARIVTGVWYTRDEFEEAVRLLDTGEVPAHAAPVGVAPLIEAPRAMKELLARQSPHLKVLLQP